VFNRGTDDVEDINYVSFETKFSDLVPAGTYAGESTLTKAFCLQNGTYTFIIYDAYGDGTGYYKLPYNGEILVEGGAFGSSESTTFDVSM